MGWARYKGGLLLVAIFPILLLASLFSLSPELNDSASANCTDYLGGCFTSAENLVPANTTAPEEFQDVDEFLGSANISDSAPPDNQTIGPEQASSNETGCVYVEGACFTPVDEIVTGQNESAEEFQPIDEYLNETGGGFFSMETLQEAFSTNETAASGNETPAQEENETSQDLFSTNETALNETLPAQSPIPEGYAVIGDLLLGKGGRPINAEVVLSSGTKGSQVYKREKWETTGLTLPKGEYKLVISPHGNPIKEIAIDRFPIDGDLSGMISLDEPDEGSVPGPQGTRFSEVYVFNPHANISGSFTVRATSSQVYKCKDWNFDLRFCEGEWVNILNVTPGEYYTVYFNSSDPAYGEGGSYFTLANITLDGNFDDWSAVFANPHNVMYDGTSGIDDLDVVGTPNRDLTRYAFTWDGTYFYSYFRRTSAGTNEAHMLLYIDVKNDGLLGADDYVIRYAWMNNQDVDVFLYNYTPSNVSGDQITGDGQTEPGSSSNQVQIESLLPGRGANGIELESRFNWSIIGLAPGQPFGLHVSTALGSGTILPGQVEDNANAISTLATELDISPDREGAGDNGMTVGYNHTVTNLGNQNDTVSITTSGTTPGFIVNLTYANGTPLTDTNNDSILDVGPLAPGASVNITLFLTIVNASTGDIDETYVTATSTNKTSVSDSVLDTTYIGALVIFPDRSGSIFNGTKIYYNHTVLSNLPGSNVIAINASSSNNYSVNFTYLNLTPLTDTDSDGIIDLGNLTQGESKTILAWITIPAAASIGTTEYTEILALRATNHSVNSSAFDTTTVSKAVTIFPNRTGYISAGSTSYVFYEHLVTNSQNFTSAIALSYNSSLGWNVSFYASDAATLLTDTDGDGLIDTGNLSAFGGSTIIYVKVKHPGGVSNGTTDTTNITANSTAYSWAWDRVTDVTTARILITYQDAFHTAPSDNFNKTDTVYANAYGLVGYTNVYYMWYDSEGNLLRTSPSLAVDTNYEAQDKLALNYTLPSGAYILYLRDSIDDSLVDFHFFNVFGPLEIRVVSPNGGELWRGNQTILYNITDRSGNNVSITLEYSPDGGSSWFNFTAQKLNTTPCTFDPLLQCVEGVFNYTWDTTTVSDGPNYLIRVTANDTSSVQSDRSDLVFIIDNSRIYSPNDGLMVYRSNTGSCASNLLNCPKVKPWDATGNGTWGAEMELPTAGSPVRWAVIKRAPLSDKAVIVTLSDDGWLDGYVCTENCTNKSNWIVTNNIGSVGTAPGQRKFDIEFETLTSNLVLVYSVNSTSPDRDLAYKVLPANSSNFSGLSEQYINDTGHATDLTYTWVRMDRKPTLSPELAMVAFDYPLDNDINAWIWNGTAWGSQTELSNAATWTGGYEALAVRYAYDGSKGMAIGAEGASGAVNTKYWNGTAWSAAVSFTAPTSNRDVQWINLKADPATDDLQAVVADTTRRLHTSYWNGSGWAVSSNIAVTDCLSTRCADFDWYGNASAGRLVWDQDGASTTLSYLNCSPQCSGTPATISTYAGTGAWITMYRNPGSIGTVKILSARLNSNNDIGSFLFDGTVFGNYGDANITADTTVTTYEAYSIHFRTRELIPPQVNFTYPTPPNGSVIYVNYTFINTTVTDNLNISMVYLEWNGVNESMNLSGTDNWFKNKTGLASGTYTYKVWAIDVSGNIAVTETRVLYYGNPPLVYVINPLGEAYADRRPVPLVINATDPDGINFTSATVTYPNGSTRNVTLYNQVSGDNFNIDTMGTNWISENTSLGPSQTCIADIDTTIPGEAYVSLSGDGSPLTDSLCTIISKGSFYGDFDMNISFQLRGTSGPDWALNFQLTETQTSAEATRTLFLSLSNWTGQGKTYEVFADDGNYSGYLSTRPTNDTYGRFRIKRENNTFTFYTWNNNASSWILESSANLSMSSALYLSFEAESTYPGWSGINASFNDFQASGVPYYQNVFNDTIQLGLYNVTFYARDNTGAINDSERTNFTVIAVNDRPSVPFLLAPPINSVISGLYNITWVQVVDEENDNVWFNITLLNPDGSPNSSLVSNYGNLNTTHFEWNTSNHADGNYSLYIVVFENETPEHLENSYTLNGNFTIDNTPPIIQFEYPTDNSSATLNRSYVLINVSAYDITLANITVRLYNSTGGLVNQSASASSPLFLNISGLPDGLYYFNATAYDGAGHISSTETRNVTISTGLQNCPVISSPGSYTMPFSFSGAPNNASPLSDYACVKITSSNVVFDCAGYNITGDGTAGTTYGILLNGSLSNVTIMDCPGISGYTNGIYIYQSNSTSVSNSSASNNTNGIYLYQSGGNNLSNNSAYNNSAGGILIIGAPGGNTLYGNRACYNSLVDVNSTNSTNSGTLGTCGTYSGWYENGHAGCTFKCTTVWHYFFGNLSGNLFLAPNNVEIFYSWAWNGQKGRIYALNGDAPIEWSALVAIGRNTTGGNSTGDFTDLDSLLNISSASDNINITYSYDGSNPWETENMTLFELSVPYVPQANSSAFFNPYKTGIAWDSSQDIGDAEFNNETFVFVSEINGTSTYDYEIMVPGTLDTYTGTSGVVSVWVELD